MAVSNSYKIHGYYPTIGIECHVQLKTKTKLFAAINNNARDAAPNTLVSHICFGMPGALPVLNKEAVFLAAKAAFALNTTPQLFSKFDRKHYFYPDLPLGYQISQFDEPIILGGHIDARVDGETKRIAITRAHLEADAGKSTHPAGKNYSLVDLNRAGTPLLEIVSEPEMHNAAEARAYAQELYLSMKYADVSDVDLYHGNMRFDVNVSVSKNPDKLGTRSETKNLNSFKSIEKAVEYEIKRQIELLEDGEEVVQETRGWLDDEQKTFSQRSKEDAHDYRYFPDPDLPPVVIEQATIDTIAESMPKMPHVYREEFTSIGIDPAQIETLLTQPVVTEMVNGILEREGEKTTKTIINWLTGPVVKLINDEGASWDQVIDADWVGLAGLTHDSKVSSTGAKEIIPIMLSNGKNAQQVADDTGLVQLSNSGEIEKIVDEVIADNPKPTNDVQNGEVKAIGFLVGQVMKRSQGKANPALAKEILEKKLGV